MEKIKILIAEDHKIVRDGLISCLKKKKNFDVIGEASSGEEAVKKALELIPDIVLMDISMPGMGGIEATKTLKKRAPKIKVLVLTMHQEEEYALEIIHSGAKGYVLKNISADELITSIESVYKGNAVFNPEISQVVLNDYINIVDNEEKKKQDILTDREIEVLKLTAEGYSSKEIALKLFLSIRTINAHRDHIMKKLEIHSALGLTKYAIEEGYVKIKNK